MGRHDTEPTILEPDTPPKSGVWADPEDYLAHPTDVETTEGNRQGRDIDPEDDTDTGS